jgi:hypothetical protein
MPAISLDQYEKVLEYVVLGLHEPIMVVGQAGVGKTQKTEQFCERVDAYLCTCILGQYDTVDMRGTPWDADIGGGYHATVWRPASTLPFKGNPNFPKDKPIILFFDERTSATVPVLGVCYQIVDKRRVGEHELMDNVYIVSAGNREMDKGIVTRQPLPLCNRETWYEVGSNVDQWCIWATQKYGAKAAIFVAFLQFRKPLICTYDPAKSEKNFASPRTIEKALKYYLSDMPQDIKQASIAGAVGGGWAAEFWGFVDSWAEIAKMMPAIAANPLTAEIPAELSLQYAVAIAISGTLTEKNARVFHPYLVRMLPEFAVLAWHMAVKRDEALFETDEFLDFSHRYKVVF